MTAYVCVPGMGSEPGVGWEFVQLAAREHQVTLLTNEDCARRTMAVLEKTGLANVEVIAVPSPSFFARHNYRFGLVHADYLVWQRRTRRLIRNLARDFDVVHHVTFTSDWQPSAVLRQKDLPAVWGPVGSLAPMPWALVPHLFPRSVAAQLARQSVTRVFRARRRREVQRSGLVVVAVSDATADYFGHAKHVRIEATCALDPVVSGEIVPALVQPNGRRTLLFIGRLVAFKGAGVALAVMKRLPEEWHLDIYGEGVEEERIRARAKRLKISHRVHFLGVRPREEVARAFQTADAMLFPSMSDGSSYAVAEAVRAGCPVVCLDLGGPPVLVRGTNGVVVSADRHAVGNLAAAVQQVRRSGPDDRFSRERLPRRFNEWYETAIADANA